MVKDDQYVAGAWTRRSDDVHGWTVCRERHDYRDVGVRATQDAKAEDAEAAMVKDDRVDKCSCYIDTSTV